MLSGPAGVKAVQRTLMKLSNLVAIRHMWRQEQFLEFLYIVLFLNLDGQNTFTVTFKGQTVDKDPF